MNEPSEFLSTSPAVTSVSGHTLTIRKPTPVDFDLFLPAAVAIFSAGPYSSLDILPGRARSVIEQWMGDERRFIRIAELEKTPVAVMIGYVTEQWFSSEITGHDTVLFVIPGYRNLGIGQALVSEFVSWCKYMGARLAFVSSSTEMELEVTQAICEGAGLRFVGPIYMKDLGDV